MLKVSFLEETLKNYNAKAGVRDAFFSVNAVLRVYSATVKYFGKELMELFQSFSEEG